MAPLKAKASPTKAFFVRMLTRDITLDDCILDLVDNSVDGAWKSSGEQPSSLEVSDKLAEYRVSISISTTKFEISDNCGGIDLDTAMQYAFTFGRSDEQPPPGYTVGVYGIGMKRASFKIGNAINITSTYQDGEILKAFRVPIDVRAWLLDRNENDWDFDIIEAEPADSPGVTITITELADETKTLFDDPRYERDLRKVLERDYMMPLMRGFQLSLNGKPIPARQPTIRQGQAFHPMRTSYKDGDVRVEIIAGMWHLPPDTSEPEEESRIDSTSGWYMLCNGRAVLSADRSPVTGWGMGLPRWHSQYNGFIGFALFSAEEPAKLPMTTTKRSLDTSSTVYLRALARMHDPARAWIDYTNSRKKDLEKSRQVEARTRAKPLSEVPTRPSVQLPKVTAKKENVANVNYAVETDRMLALASALGDRTMSYRDVGLSSFDYTYEALVDEDEA